jgi:hypothetical protein
MALPVFGGFSNDLTSLMVPLIPPISQFYEQRYWRHDAHNPPRFFFGNWAMGAIHVGVLVPLRLGRFTG